MPSSSLEERLLEVNAEIESAAHAVGRSATEMTLIVVTKFHPASLITDLANLGVRDIGENRHQEASDKHRELADLDVRWHFIGQLQTKKARQVARYADVIHSIDRTRLVEALSTIESPKDVFVQVNLTDDPGRGGVAEVDLEPLVEAVESSGTLNLRGLMAVAPIDAEPAEAFAKLAQYSERAQRISPNARELSAGMTHDFREAIAAGATHLRIGSAITGNRPEAR